MAYKKSAYNILIQRDNYTIAYNSYSGTLCKLDEAGVACLENLDEDSPFFQAMVGQGLIVDSTLDEFGRVIREYNNYIHDDSPETLQYTIALTTACNLRCVYCFEENHCPEYATKETMDAIVRFVYHELTYHQGIKNLHITWFGGEPMLTYEQILDLSKRLIMVCKRRNVNYSAGMITNGLLLTEEKLQNLKDVGVKGIQVTLDGTPEQCEQIKKGKRKDFEQLLRNLPAFAKIVHVKIRLNACMENLDGIIELYRKLTMDGNPYSKVYISKIEKYNEFSKTCTPLSEHEYTDFVIERMGEAVANGVDIMKISRFPKRRKAYCGSMQKFSSAIGPDGSLYVGEHCIGDNTHVIGNVRYPMAPDEKPLTEYEAFTEKPYTAACGLCNLFPICLGGCPANRVIYNIPPDCEEFRKNVRNELILAAEKYGK